MIMPPTSDTMAIPVFFIVVKFMEFTLASCKVRAKCAIFVRMICDSTTTAAFTGHRTYGGEAVDALQRTLEALYLRGFRTFLSGMAVGFDLAAAEVVLGSRAGMPGLRLVAVVPFRGQEGRFAAADRERFRRVMAAADEVVVLSEVYHRGCYAVRNDFLVGNASLVVAWYDGSPGGTHYTVRRAARRRLELINLHPAAPIASPRELTLF